MSGGLVELKHGVGGGRCTLPTHTGKAGSRGELGADTNVCGDGWAASGSIGERGDSVRANVVTKADDDSHLRGIGREEGGKRGREGRGNRQGGRDEGREGGGRREERGGTREQEGERREGKEGGM